MGFDPAEIAIEGGEYPPLYVALYDRDFELAEKLISGGKKLDDLIEADGETFLHRAAQLGDLEMIDFFLDYKCSASLESFDGISNTPLICAAGIGHIGVVDRLLTANANPNGYDVDGIGDTAIKEAVRGGHTDIVFLLLQAGADPTIPGWMNISAVDQAWYEIKGTHTTMRDIRALLSKYPSSLRDRLYR